MTPDATTIYVADLSNNAIRVVTNANNPSLCMVATQGGGNPAGAGFADGVGTNARFSAIREIGASAISGDVIVGDYGNNAVRRVTPAGVTTTVAGGNGGLGTAGYKDATGTNALMWGPRSATMLLNGDICEGCAAAALPPAGADVPPTDAAAPLAAAAAPPAAAAASARAPSHTHPYRRPRPHRAHPTVTAQTQSSPSTTLCARSSRTASSRPSRAAAA